MFNINSRITQRHNPQGAAITRRDRETIGNKLERIYKAPSQDAAETYQGNKPKPLWTGELTLNNHFCHKQSISHSFCTLVACIPEPNQPQCCYVESQYTFTYHCVVLSKKHKWNLENFIFNNFTSCTLYCWRLIIIMIATSTTFGLLWMDVEKMITSPPTTCSLVLREWANI